MNEESIFERRRRLDKERREFAKKAMAEYDKGHYERLKALQNECGSAGHNWRFIDFGPVGHPWYSCSNCHLSEVRGRDV